MDRITAALERHHRHCDELLASAEDAAQQGNWEDCGRLFGEFAMQLGAHFRTEEEVLFPAFENQTGMLDGPTRIMRIEHHQMRDLVREIEVAALRCDELAFSGSVEVLLVLMQQHNLKEENILYPLCDKALSHTPERVREDIRIALAA